MRGAGAVANALSDVLAAPGWYTNFETGLGSVVIFPGRVFRYPHHDAAARHEAEQHARTLGIPESQLDW